MQIFMDGTGSRDFAPDLIRGSVTFTFRATTYDEALKGGVERVKNFIDTLASATDFKAEDFKTRAYSVREEFHIAKIDPKTEADLEKNLQRRISDGFSFSQYAYIEFDYDKERLVRLLAVSSKVEGAPRMHIDFDLKDIEAKRRDLLAAAYEDARLKAEALATAAGKNLRDCVRVNIDTPAMDHGGYFGGERMMAKRAGISGAEIEEEIKTIDETFQPDDITLSKTISCIWETSN